ncbi:MAG: YtxH domain-containing protein [Dehalococcoidia bacterium]|nr:YtxH domain-containing protein [Dehalococcoidia bacterium]
MSNGRGPGFSSGLLLGGIIGALIGLLSAPKPGEETRAQVREKTAGLRQKAEELTSEARELILDVLQDGRGSKYRQTEDDTDIQQVATEEK